MREKKCCNTTGATVLCKAGKSTDVLTVRLFVKRFNNPEKESSKWHKAVDIRQYLLYRNMSQRKMKTKQRLS